MPSPPVQKNVPLDVDHHAKLKRISILEDTSMKNVVHTWIDSDGRGAIPEIPEKEIHQHEPEKEPEGTDNGDQ